MVTHHLSIFKQSQLEVCVAMHMRVIIHWNCHAINERPISSIKFASFGTPQGTCGSFQKGNCEATKDALSILQNVCKFFRCLFLLSFTYIYIYIYIFIFM